MRSWLERLMTNRVRAWDLLKHSALEEELEQLHPASFAWAMACCRWSRPDAEEVLQAAYFKVLNAQAVYGGRATVKTWLFGVIRNTAADHRRRRFLEAVLVHRWLVRREAPALAPAADELLAREQRRRRIVDALRRLARRQREVLELVFYQGMTIEESAEVMGVSIGSARVHYDRGKRRMLGQLGEEEIE
jgi:RNA polymerase sigma-70 factor (ECF subfamily)